MDYITRHLTWTDIRNELYLEDGEVLLALLDAAHCTYVTDRHGKVLLECYIDPDILLQMADEDGEEPDQYLINNILPSARDKASGNFGEILARSVLQGFRDCPRFPVCKWREGWTRNASRQGTDLIGYVLRNAEPESPDDILVMCEVKTRSASVSDTVVKDAYDGVKQDYASRMADSLFFQRRWLNERGSVAEARNLARFAKPHQKPYKKRLVAFVVHDDSTWQDAFLSVLPLRHDLEGNPDVDVMILRVEKCAAWIDRVHDAAAEAAVR